jgi:hypothetical protein
MAIYQNRMIVSGVGSNDSLRRKRLSRFLYSFPLSHTPNRESVWIRAQTADEADEPGKEKQYQRGNTKQ